MAILTVTSIADIRAASRLTPRMVAYRLKRIGRDLLAQRKPSLYALYIQSTANSVPPLEVVPDSELVDLARRVAAYYLDEYVDSIQDAANGRFTLFDQTVDFGSVDSIDWHYQLDAESDFHLWRQKFAHMGYLCPMLVAATDQYLDAVQGILSSYSKSAKFDVPDCFSSYWFPYSVSHRILAILSGYILHLSKNDMADAIRIDIENFLRWNAGFLLVNIEHELRNNHVERNLAALCLYFSCVKAPPFATIRRLDREVRRIMDACILADGFSIERSSMYQGLAVMALEIFSRAGCLSSETREIAMALHTRAGRAWQLMTHPDGDIALFNDSWLGEVPRPSSVTPARNFSPLEVLPEAGYARLQSGSAFAIMDAGPIGPRWCPGHGHADFLATEIDIASKRFIVDPGTFQYSTGPRRAYERSAESHNGPAWSGIEPVEYSGCFRVGRMTAAEFVETSAFDGGGKVRARLNFRNGSAVERSIVAVPDMLLVTDEWFGNHSDPGVRLTVSGDWSVDDQADGYVVFRAQDRTAELSVTRGKIARLDRTEWSCHYLESLPATMLTLIPDVDSNGTRLEWRARTCH